MRQRTLVMFKPNLVESYETLNAADVFFSQAWLIQATRRQQLPVEFFREFYQHVSEPDLTVHTTFCASGQIMVMVFEYEDIFESFRRILGATDSSKANPRSLRGYYYTKFRPKNPYDNFAHTPKNQTDFVREGGLLIPFFPTLAGLIV